MDSVAPSSPALPSYDDELAADQRTALRIGALLASGLILAFAALDAWLAPSYWLELLVIRAGASGVLLASAKLVARPGARALTWALVILAAVCVPIEAGVFATGGAQSAYLYSMLLPMAAVVILVPFRMGEVAAVQVEVLAIALVPLLAFGRPGDGMHLWVPGSFMLTMAIIGVTGAGVQQRLREREYRSRAEAARQLHLAHLGQLAGGLAHELSNPLSAMSIELELMDRNRRATPAGKSLDRLRIGMERMRDILQAMRQGARVADGQMRPTDLAKQVELALTLIGPQLREVSVARELQPVPTLPAQPTLLGQLLTNLLLNAAQAVSGRSERKLVVRTLVHDDRAVIEIEDNGPGVPEDLRERIFEPLFSTKGEEGNGLGLWICAEIARFHQGTLTVRDGKNLGGALFRVELPLRASEQPTIPSP